MTETIVEKDGENQNISAVNSDDKPLWYFAHPYSASTKPGQIRNFELANERAIRLLDAGYMIFSPISHSHPLQEVKDSSRDYWISLDKCFMNRCDGLILAPGWKESKGCRIEKEYFEKTGKFIKLFEEMDDI